MSSFAFIVALLLDQAVGRRELAGQRVVGGREPERLADRRAHRQRELLQALRDERQADVVEVVVRDHGEPERVRHALPVRLAVGRERVHRRDQPLELERRRDGADEAHLVVACVPELVRRLRLDGDRLAGPQLDLLAAAPHPERSREHLEALGLEGVDVRRGDEAAGLHDRLEDDALAAGLGGGLVEDEPLAGDGILDLISCVEHVLPP